MTNALVPNRNALVRRNRAGQIQVGGPISIRDINAVAAQDPWINALAYLVAGSAPVSGDVMAIEETGRAMNRPLTRGATELGVITDSPESRGAEIGLNALGVLPFIPAMGGIIASKRAATANLGLLKKAEKMKKAGKDADDIFKQTGWWLDHPDGVPRFEIDDSLASMGDIRTLPQGERMGPMGATLEHQELYKNYPDAKRIELFGNEGFGGRYDPSADRVHASNQSVTLHELQHAIQSREGMARGGSPSQFVPDYARAKALDAMMSEHARNKFGKSAIEYQDELFAKALKETDGSQAAISRYIETNLDDVLRQDDEYLAMEQEFKRLVSSGALDSPDKKYRRLAGEAEARLVQDRMNLTPAERAARPFYKEFDVPIDEQIVRMEDGTMQSLPMDEASRMARAREMGFSPDDWFHATHDDFKQFDLAKSGTSNDLGAGQNAVFLINDTETANTYLGGAFVNRKTTDPLQSLDMGDDVGRTFTKGGNIMPLKITGENMDVWDMDGAQFGHSAVKRAIREAREGGANGVILENVRDPGGMSTTWGKPASVAVIFDPKNIRSKFAKFDPAKKNSANILAGTAAGAVGLNLLMGDDAKAQGVEFDPNGSDYDYQTAIAAGMGPDGTGINAGHWGSVAPAPEADRRRYNLPEESYLILKGANHPTFGKAVQGEESRGFRVERYGDRYYSVPMPTRLAPELSLRAGSDSESLKQNNARIQQYIDGL